MPEQDELDDRYALRYSRARRLAKAPKEIQEIYARRAAGGKRGIFAFLRGNRGLMLVFATVIAFTLFYVLYSFITRDSGSPRLGPYNVRAQAQAEPGAIRVGLELKRSRALKEGEEGMILRLRTSVDGLTFQQREFALSGIEKENFFFVLESSEPPPQIECILDLGPSVLSLRLPLRSSNQP